jgi:hypothetical protein
MQETREAWAASEAKRKAEDEEKNRLRIEQEKLSADSIICHLTASGETASLAEAVVAMLKHSQRLLKACAGTDVSIGEVDRVREKAKQANFGKALEKMFPEWHLSDKQKADLVLQVLSTHSSVQLASFRLESAYDAFVAALSSALSDGSENFHCQVCMDPLARCTAASPIFGDGVSRRGVASSAWFALRVSTGHWASEPCGHAFCRSCMATWVETAIGEQKTSIRCPAVECSYKLWDHDVKGLVSPQVFERYQEMKNVNYFGHLKEAMKDLSLKRWLKSHARPCPDCHVIVSRSEGCDHMMCVCGTKFCYACGHKKCICNSAKKHRSIWNPTQ